MIFCDVKRGCFLVGIWLLCAHSPLSNLKAEQPQVHSLQELRLIYNSLKVGSKDEKKLKVLADRIRSDQKQNAQILADPTFQTRPDMYQVALHLQQSRTNQLETIELQLNIQACFRQIDTTLDLSPTDRERLLQDIQRMLVQLIDLLDVKSELSKKYLELDMIKNHRRRFYKSARLNTSRLNLSDVLIKGESVV